MSFTPSYFDEAKFDHSWFDTIVFIIIKCKAYLVKKLELKTYITKKLRLKNKTL